MPEAPKLLPGKGFGTWAAATVHAVLRLAMLSHALVCRTLRHAALPCSPCCLLCLLCLLPCHQVSDFLQRVRSRRFPPIEKDMRMVLAHCGSLLLDPAALQEV